MYARVTSARWSCYDSKVTMSRSGARPKAGGPAKSGHQRYDRELETVVLGDVGQCLSAKAMWGGYEC